MAAAKQKKRSDWMKQADAVFTKLVRERDGRCVGAGTDHLECKGHLQCAHVISRSYKSIRCDFDNAITLCQAHHFYYTNRPDEWKYWVDENYPGRWKALMDKALQYERVDWKRRLQELKGRT